MTKTTKDSETGNSYLTRGPFTVEMAYSHDEGCWVFTLAGPVVGISTYLGTRGEVHGRFVGALEAIDAMAAMFANH